MEKLKIDHQYGWDGANGGSIYETAPNNLEITKKINEIIDYLNNTPETTKRTYMSTKTGAIIDDWIRKSRINWPLYLVG